jgi:RNA polymerase sigma-70 factor (ECF subfamily)
MHSPRKTANLENQADLTGLMVLVQNRDQSALTHLYDATVGKVYARALRITGNRADAEEVTCDAYHQLWRNAQQFNAARGTPLQWLMVIVRSRALDCCRSRNAQRKLPRDAAYECTPETECVLEQALYPGDMDFLIRETLAQLNAVQARLIGLAFFEGLSHQEIAECTGLALGTVKSHLCRALIVMRRALVGTGHLGSRPRGARTALEEVDLRTAASDYPIGTSAPAPMRPPLPAHDTQYISA